jgi:hypothetical protein
VVYPGRIRLVVRQALGLDGKHYAEDVERTEQGLQLVLGGVRPQTMKDNVHRWKNEMSDEDGRGRGRRL